jgi:hypothetical protein
MIEDSALPELEGQFVHQEPSRDVSTILLRIERILKDTKKLIESTTVTREVRSGFIKISFDGETIRIPSNTFFKSLVFFSAKTNSGTIHVSGEPGVNSSNSPPIEPGESFGFQFVHLSQLHIHGTNADDIVTWEGEC